MEQRLWIVDLDRTLFDTGRFIADVTLVLERHFAISPARMKATMANYTTAGELGYNFFAHAQVLTGQSEASLTQLLLAELAGDTYLFDESESWLNSGPAAGHDIVVATVGQANFQELKFTFAKPLKYYPHRVVGKDKGFILKTELTEVPGGYRSGFSDQAYPKITLVDDNPTTFFGLGPHADIRQILVRRPNQKYSNTPAPDYLEEVTSLKEII
jgi:hypothetical protein